jgi:hypothetical protein
MNNHAVVAGLQQRVETLESAVTRIDTRFDLAMRGGMVDLTITTLGKDRDGRATTLSSEKRRMVGEGLSVITEREKDDIVEKIVALSKCAVAQGRFVESAEGRMQRLEIGHSNLWQALAAALDEFHIRLRQREDGVAELTKYDATPADVIRLSQEQLQLNDELRLRLRHEADDLVEKLATTLEVRLHAVIDREARQLRERVHELELQLREARSA